MSLAGRLEDVSVSDVMQFIHLGRRTGTLQIESPPLEARILFHEGSIVGARLSSGERIGELLVSLGTLTQEVRDSALERQDHDHPERTLGQNLLDMGAIDLEAIRSAIRHQVESTIYGVVAWSSGTFEFELDRLEPIDDIAFLPADLIPELDLNTQMVLLEAARVFDEKRRQEAEDLEASPKDKPIRDDLAAKTPPLATPIPTVETPATIDQLLVEVVESAAHQQGPTGGSRLELVCDDSDLAASLEHLLQDSGSTVVRVSVETAGATNTEARPIIAFELTDGGDAVDKLALVCSRNRGIPVICILDDVTLRSQAYGAGATAVVPPDAEAVVGCFRSLDRFRVLADLGKTPSPRTDFERLHRVVADLRSGVFSASVALTLMKVISESVERAVLFLVKGRSLTTLGAFGFDHRGRPLAEKTRGLRLELTEEDGLSRAIEERRAMTTSFDAAHLTPAFIDAIDRPVFEEVALFPVLGVDRVILVVYADNGNLNRGIEEVEILDLAAAEVGIAFENELLRRQLSKQS